MKPRILFYSQHVLGFGHLVRSIEILRGLGDFEVCFVNGGTGVADLPMPADVQVVQLPPLESNADFTDLRQHDDEQSLDDIKSKRTNMLLDVYEQFAPDVMMFELFPFGRTQFGFELLPLLAHAKQSMNPPKVVCSLRDILVSKHDADKRDERVCQLVNHYFDLVLVHADPSFQRLEDSFSRFADLRVPVRYTGYVVQPITPIPAQERLPLSDDLPLVVASIGGGRVGSELLRGAIAASELLRSRVPHQLLALAGPFASDRDVSALKAQAAGHSHIHVEQFSKHLVAYLACSSLSISMAGYNTCMNIVTTGVPALVLPFTGGGNDEQTVRARKLADLGLVTVLSPGDLEATRLAELMENSMRQPRNTSGLDISGSARLGELLRPLVEAKQPRRTPHISPASASDDAMDAGCGHWLMKGDPWSSSCETMTSTRILWSCAS